MFFLAAGEFKSLLQVSASMVFLPNRRCISRNSPEQQLFARIKTIIGDQPTYGYRRIWAMPMGALRPAAMFDWATPGDSRHPRRKLAQRRRHTS
jgi:hypothetical protein